MESFEVVIKTITAEMQKSISAKTVIGDPMTFGGTTIIPLSSVGMGFGAGTGAGKTSDNAEGSGGGGGMAIKPVAIVVMDEKEAKLETLKPPSSVPKKSVVEQIVEALPKLAEGMSAKKEEK